MNQRIVPVGPQTAGVAFGNVRTTFEVAVVGGGIAGLSAARELRRAGVRDVLVLEREPSVGQGSSARANGGVRAQFTTPANIAFSLHSIAEFERLREAHGDLLGFHQTGYLFVTATDEGERALGSARQLQRSLGVETEWLEPAAIGDLAPIVDPDGVRGGNFHPRDGFLDPHGALEVMRLECRAASVTIRTGSEVTGISRQGDGFSLAAGDDAIAAGWVVDAAGPHAAHVAALLGIQVPIEPVRRNLAFVRADGEPSGLIPMCIDVETGVLVRKEVGGGYLLAYSNPDDPPGWDTSVDPRFLEELAARIGNRFPSLRDVPIDARHAWAGLYPETPDHQAIVGEAPGLERFVICGGFGGHGLMHAPAAGLAVAEIVTTGRCATFDIRPFRPSRFAEGDLSFETAVL